MAEPSSLEQVLIRELRRWRELRGLTAQQLADRTQGQLSRQAISKIENASRRVTLDEFACLAVALDVPPLALLVPLDGSQVAVTPGLSVSAMDLVVWFEGKSQPGQPLPTVGFIRAAAPLRNYGLISETLTQATAQERSAYRSQAGGDESAAEEAFRMRDVKVQAAALLIETLIDVGVQPPAVARRWVDQMIATGWLERPEYVPVIEPTDDEGEDDGGSDQED
ncbi:helix-turn-helix domain-containing protein [Streptosporangium sp. DT93]|uniref:helix-turn-helix domain-containing protein n=1 Tax=Streptosporangium sp. DT93 TaxID=3393428 RepID=UPI003CEF5166